jgi:signal peptidase I
MEYNNKQSQTKELLKTIVLAVVVALCVRMFVLEIYLVDGTSMVPTLEDSEYLFVNKFIYRFRQPKVGEIIVFKFAGDKRKDFIKRVIAVGGQTVEIKNGQVFVDGEETNEPFISELTLGHFGPVKVPEGKYFVLGDNRNHSSDSRFPEVGFIDPKTIEGKAVFVFWPLNSAKKL